MRPRLLPRKEIDGIKARERQAEIAEGTKLAKRVDVLRELQAKEEAGLTKWRNETLAAMEAEILKKAQEKDKIEVELRDKRQELTELFLPLKREKERLEKEKESLNVSLIEVELQKANLDEVLQMNKALEEQNKKELQKRASERQENERVLEEAQEELKEADEMLVAAKEEAARTRENAKVIRLRADKKENAVAQWEKELILKSNILAAKEEELERRELEVIVKELQFNSPVHGKHNNADIPQGR